MHEITRNIPYGDRVFAHRELVSYRELGFPLPTIKKVEDIIIDAAYIPPDQTWKDTAPMEFYRLRKIITNKVYGSTVKSHQTHDAYALFMSDTEEGALHTSYVLEPPRHTVTGKLHKNPEYALATQIFAPIGKTIWDKDTDTARFAPIVLNFQEQDRDDTHTHYQLFAAQLNFQIAPDSTLTYHCIAHPQGYTIDMKLNDDTLIHRQIIETAQMANLHNTRLAQERLSIQRMLYTQDIPQTSLMIGEADTHSIIYSIHTLAFEGNYRYTNKDHDIERIQFLFAISFPYQFAIANSALSADGLSWLNLPWQCFNLQIAQR